MLADHVDEVKCDVCGHLHAHIRTLTRTYGKGKELLVIENVPTVSCPNCGSHYLTSETSQKLERIKQERKAVSVTRPVAVANFC
jgi:YgiT-type zinc finger domain-containing protein